MEAMQKSFLLANFVSALLAVLVSAQVPFDIESEFPQDSEASTFSQESQYFPDSDPDEPSLLSQSEFPQDSRETKYFPQSNDEETSLFPEFEHPYDSLEAQNFPDSNADETSLFSEFEHPYDSLGIDAPSLSPSPPSTSEPWYTCEYKCSLKCRKEKFSLLQILCYQVCKTKCILRYLVPVYNCTSRCAETMPETFKSDEKRSAEYVKFCYKKCNKLY